MPEAPLRRMRWGDFDDSLLRSIKFGSKVAQYEKNEIVKDSLI